ncbi:DUF4097 family beta strand repeat-containing protein [Streptomyces sp. SID3343]|uniref:DUF4097 family beta strand repeat-containing protein n=1 Tax=Streptomyces sp. SID3343 TaxID=2690260 RepID=UPI001367FA3A|nr:DUF4097 family beta strand repeat-containing protein [Streptomyces sp. SID3343]MYV97956.1 DUF4097 family beta strand repeat protein [Streptomyces sp. SID3343]
MTVTLVSGQVRIVASDRAETMVEAYPSDSDDHQDVQTAAQLRIGFADGRLFVNDPKPGGSCGAVIVVMVVPTGSSLHGRGVAMDFFGVGELGECRLRTDLGRIRLDRTGSLRLATSFGDITVDRAVGTVEATANRGDVHLGCMEGSARVTARGEGDVRVGEVRGVARLRAEKGAVWINRAYADVNARTTQGDIEVGEMVRGSVVATTTFGDIRVGVAETSDARLSLDSAAGTVYTSLSLLTTNERTDEIVCVQARTVVGDIVVQRSGGGE